MVGRRTATPRAPAANRPHRSAGRPGPSAATGPTAARAATGASPATAGAATAGPARRGSAPAAAATTAGLTAEGEARLRAELDELTTVRRPEVIARIRTAKEHGDLKENAEYHAAREEQSFLEGRVQAIEARLRTAVIVEAPAAGSRVGLGSVVTVDDDGETVSYTIVGADESDPASGRISSSSPVGRALVGRDCGRRGHDPDAGRRRGTTGSWRSARPSARPARAAPYFWGSTSLCSTAYRAACVRDARPSLPRMFET